MARSADPVEAALRALRSRDLSMRDLGRRLEAKGFDAGECAQALATLERTGLVDDERFARSRARTLASRGAGNALIRHDLLRASVERDLVELLLDELEPEDVRARAIVARRGVGSKTARYLRSKGFGDEVVAAVANERSSGIG